MIQDKIRCYNYYLRNWWVWKLVARAAHDHFGKNRVNIYHLCDIIAREFKISSKFMIHVPYPAYSQIQTAKCAQRQLPPKRVRYAQFTG